MSADSWNTRVQVSLHPVHRDHCLIYCKEYMYTDVIAVKNGTYGRGNGSIVLDDLLCLGNEENLFQCGITTYGQHDCSHLEDAGVICGGERSCVINDSSSDNCRLLTYVCISSYTSFPHYTSHYSFLQGWTGKGNDW